VFLLGGKAMSPRGQRAAARIAAASKSRFYSETFPARAARGGGLPDIDRLPYFPEAAMKALDGADQVVLAGALVPVAYFGYPGLPSRLAPEEKLLLLAEPGEDAEAALEAVAEALGAPAHAPGVTPVRYAIEDGELTPQSIGRVLSNALPEGAIVSVEGGTCGYPFVTASAQAGFHEVLTNTGGAIGQGIPCAVGAAIAAPDRRVFSLQSDGSALYTIQALWTAAREQLDLTVLIASNRRYAILQNELARAGTGEPGEQARRLTELDHPALDWQALAKAHGVSAVLVNDNSGLARELSVAGAERGPRLIEMVL
jgi:acetolactate synthase-1/2/3 large subunit